MDTTELAAHVVGSGATTKELFERILERIQRYFQRLVRDPQDVEDCLQETVLLLQRSFVEEKYDPSRSFNVWLWLKARSVFGKWCKHRGRRMRSLDPGVAKPGNPQRSLERKLDAKVILDEVLERLGPETQEAFVLYYDAELTKQEVGEVLGLHRKAVAKKIREAHALIETLLEDR